MISILKTKASRNVFKDVIWLTNVDLKTLDAKYTADKTFSQARIFLLNDIPDNNTKELIKLKERTNKSQNGSEINVVLPKMIF